MSMKFLPIVFSALFPMVFVAIIGSGHLQVSAQVPDSEAGITAGSNRFVVWHDDTTGNGEILFRRSTDNGANWKPTVNLSNNPGVSQFPKIAVSGSNVFVTWTQGNSDGSSYDIFVRTSADNGVSWGDKTKLSVSPYSGSNARALPEIIAHLSNVYIVWDNDDKEILLRRSTDGGANWKTIVNLSNTVEESLRPRLAAIGSSVHVTWTERDGATGFSDVLFRRSLDEGASWKPTLNLSNNGFGAGSQVLASGLNVYVIWADISADNYDVYFRRSMDNGATWQPLVNLSRNSGHSVPFHMAISGSSLYVIWQDGSTGNFEILLKRSSDNGVTWKATKNLSNNAEQSFSPVVVATGSSVYVSWYDKDEQGDSDISLRRSADGGVTWKPIVNLSNNGGISRDPILTVSNGSVFVVWEERTDTSDNFEVLVRRSVDNGTTWKAVKNVSNNAGDSMDPVPVS